MYETGADFTNTFRWLAGVSLPAPSSAASNSITLHDGQSSSDAPQQNGAEASTSGKPATACQT